MAKSKKTKNQGNKQIELFLKSCFSRYMLDYDHIFFTINDELETKPIPLFKDGAVSEKILNRAAEMLGMETSDILNRNEEAAKKWFNKFPFMAHLSRFESCRQRSFYGDEVVEAILQKAIFGDDSCSFPMRYNEENIRARMIETLKEADKFLPGTYHEGADILNFNYETEQFFSYPKIGEMLGAFIDMVARAKELFFKCWDVALTEEEIKEYNFLVTSLEIVDNYVPHPVYYANLQKLINIYKGEGYKGEAEEFFDLVHLKFCYHFTPWSCKEFSENTGLAQLYTSICPFAKNRMFEFGRSVKYFSCQFKWSDSEKKYPKCLEDDIERLEKMNIKELMRETDQDIMEFQNYQDSMKETDFGEMAGWTHIHVQKTWEEMSGDEIYAEKLVRLGGVSSKGGVRIPRRKVYDGQEGMKRTMARVNVFGREFYE